MAVVSALVHSHFEHPHLPSSQQDPGSALAFENNFWERHVLPSYCLQPFWLQASACSLGWASVVPLAVQDYLAGCRFAAGSLEPEAGACCSVVVSYSAVALAALADLVVDQPSSVLAALVDLLDTSVRSASCLVAAVS